MIRVGVFGATGYSGTVLCRILARHPSAELVFATSDTSSGSLAPLLGAETSLQLVAVKEGIAKAASVDVVFFATPPKASIALAREATLPKIIDLSGAFRLHDAEQFARAYGFAHDLPDALPGAHYGLPELFGPPPKDARLVANPGCYPTATLLPVAPLLKAGLVRGDTIVVDAKSGVTGAGRSASEELSFVEVADDLRAYKIFRHQHTPEIERHLGRFGTISGLTFVPHLLPTRRGLLATCYLDLHQGTTQGDVEDCYRNFYAGAPFVSVCAAEEIRLHRVVGTNQACIGAAVHGSKVVAVGAIDNLLKGAAGQAVQNMNLWFDKHATMGLSGLFPTGP